MYIVQCTLYSVQYSVQYKAGMPGVYEPIVSGLANFHRNTLSASPAMYSTVYSVGNSTVHNMLYSKVCISVNSILHNKVSSAGRVISAGRVVFLK